MKGADSLKRIRGRWRRGRVGRKRHAGYPGVSADKVRQSDLPLLARQLGLGALGLFQQTIKAPARR